MASVFADRMILEVALYSLKKCGLHDGFEKLYNNYACEASLVDGAMFLKASPHGAKRKGRVGGAQPPPFANTTPLSRVLKGSIWLRQDDT